MASSRRLLIFLLVSFGLVLGLQYLANYHYLYFHTAVESFTILVGAAIFMIGWNARQRMQNQYLLLLAIGYFFISLLGWLHALSYSGMNFFPGVSANHPTQLWIALRYMESISLLVAPWFIRRKLNTPLTIAIYSLGFIYSVWAIFFSGHFPDCFIEGQGLTQFKKASELIIMGIFAIALIVLIRERKSFEPDVLQMIIASIVLAIAAGISFTLYSTPYGTANFIGHLFHLYSYWFIYRSIIETGIKKPFDLLFFDLAQSRKDLETDIERRKTVEEELYALTETLESRVEERTALAEFRAAQLKLMASALNEAEQQERQRLAQVLHDHLQQLLVAARMHTGRAKRKVAGGDEEKILALVDELLTQAIDSTRSLTIQLCPPVLTEKGLAAALVWLAGQMREKQGLAVAIETEGDADEKAQRYSVPLFHAIRELLFNIVKHAETHEAWVRLSTDNGSVRVVVEDKGKGFVKPPSFEGTSSKGFGLYSVQRRLSLLGGHVEIQTCPGEGTRVMIDVPVIEDTEVVAKV